MRLNWLRSSRAEDRFETWITKHHQERVLSGETAPTGPHPDEAFLRDLAPQVQADLIVRPASRPCGKLPNLHESIADSSSRVSFTSPKAGVRYSYRRLCVGCRGCFHRLSYSAKDSSNSEHRECFADCQPLGRRNSTWRTTWGVAIGVAPRRHPCGSRSFSPRFSPAGQIWRCGDSGPVGN